jgi:hypothetical protein
MPLYVQNGNLLNKTGTLGTSVGCCCPPPSCNCPEGPIEIPSSVTVVFSLGAFISSFFNGACTHDDAVDAIEGTYVLLPTVIGSEFVIYTLTTESGAVVSLKWFCTLSVSGRTAEFSFAFCDTSKECFARITKPVSIFDDVLLGLCTYPQNNVDTNTFDSDPEFVFLEQGPLIFSCTQAVSQTGRRYYFSLDITAAW